MLSHICLMAFRYEGFSVSATANVIGEGSQVLGTLKWLLGPFVLFYLLGLLRSFGVSLLTDQLRTVPADLAAAGHALGAGLVERVMHERVLIYAGAAALFGLMIERFIVHGGSLVVAIAAILIGARSARVRAGASSVPRVQPRFWLAALCAGVGLLITALWDGRYGVLLLGAGLALRWQRLYGRKSGMKGGGMAIWLATMAAWWSLGDHLAWADDGGASEFRAENPDGNLVDYVKTPAGRTVIGYGAAGGAAATGGAVAGDVAAHTTARAFGPGTTRSR
jgi:hypothetical protein